MMFSRVIEILWRKIWLSLSEAIVVCPQTLILPFPSSPDIFFLVDPVRYVTEFQWDPAKYPMKQPLKNLSEIISKVTPSFHKHFLLHTFITGSNKHRK